MFFPLAILLFVAAEFLLGWWALPVVGVILGIVGARRKAIGATVAGAALLAWVILFAWSAIHGNLGTFMQQLATSMKLKPGLLFIVLTALPALVAGPAARLGAGLRPESARNTQPVTASPG